MQGYWVMKLHCLLSAVVQAPCCVVSLFYPTVGIGFHWRTAVGFSLSPSLCAAELPRCLLCLRHLPGHPTRTCRPHPRSASSFGGWGSRGVGRSSHLGRDQEENRKVTLDVCVLQFPRIRARNELNVGVIKKVGGLA